jgi:hypothetical protein
METSDNQPLPIPPQDQSLSPVEPHQPKLNDAVPQGDQFKDLTEQNWLFIKHYLQSGKVKESWERAGYTGKSDSAPYVLFHRLKAQIEAIGELDGFNRARFLSEINKLADLPLVKDKTEVSLNEKLRILKLMGTMLNSGKELAKPKLSVFIVNRPLSSEPKNVVEVREEN